MKLLTIAIPTFNRASCLDLCLKQLSVQLEGFESEVEVIISDNCSTDETQQIALRYVTRHPNIKYIKNSQNIGPEKNFIQCFKEAESKYVLVFGDDDVFHDGTLSYILCLIRNEDYGSVYLSSSAFSGEYVKEDHLSDPKKGTIIYTNNQEYLFKIYINSTFISSNIINKSLLPKDVDLAKYLGTCLVQLGWIMPVLLSNNKHAYVERKVIGVKAYNSGGFRFFDVFVTNLINILSIYKNNGITEELYNGIIDKLLVQFYPGRIMNVRSNKEIYEDNIDNLFGVFHTQFKKNIYFWLCIVPAIYFPKNAAKFILRQFNSFHKRYSNFRAMT